MNYEEKYKEDLESAKGWLAIAKENNNNLSIQMLEKLFPELKESEDERMVKFIKNQLFNIKKTITENYELDAKLTKAIDWLERQGEQKPAEWSEEDSRILYNVKAFIGYAAGQRGVKDELFKEANEWLNSLPIGFIHNENYNEDMVTLLVDELKQIAKDNNAPEQYKAEIDWLKSLRPQPKQEWSEEVETNLDRAINIIEDAKGILSGYQTDDGIYECEKAVATLREIVKYGYSGLFTKKDRQNIEKLIDLLPQCIFRRPHIIDRDECRDLIYWLKSLRFQCQWKPSEEQMEALEKVHHAFHTKGLWDEVNSYIFAYESLMRDLQKLRLC